MNIGFTYNVRHVKPDINNPQYIKEAEFDELSTIEGIKQAIESLGHTVFLVEADEDAYLKLKELKGKIDLVFNFAEGLYGADREAQIPAMLEMLQIPYTGPKPLSYAIGLHKGKTKEILSYHGVPTAKWVVVENLEKLNNLNIDFYPVLAKPQGEGSSKGIMAKNLAHNFGQLQEVVQELLNNFHQPVLVEEFLTGREFTVGILDNPPKVLPIIEVNFDDLPEGMPKFDHYEAKWVHDNPESGADPLTCPANLTIELKKQIEESCLKTFSVLEMVDWARIDVRLNSFGIPNIIEINCPPGIMPDPKENSRFPRAARMAGLDFPQMIETILKSACLRYNINYKN